MTVSARATAQVPLRRRGGRARTGAYSVLLLCAAVGLAYVQRGSLTSGHFTDNRALFLLAPLALASRLRRVGPWRVEARAVTPAFIFAALLLDGSLAAAGVTAAALAAEAWSRPEGRRTALAQALVLACAGLLDGLVSPRAAPSPAHPDVATLELVLVFWGASEVLGAPLPWLGGRPPESIAVGIAERVLRSLLVLLGGVSLAVLWLAGPVAFFSGVVALVFLNRSVSTSNFGREALIEAKTGLFNARYFQEATESELLRCRRLERPASVLMCDLDHLREVNNRYGHQTGDLVIRMVADVIRAGTRNFDVPSRFGGEEFAILLPETSKRRARVIAERLRQVLSETEMQVARQGRRGNPQTFKVTVSIGVATFPVDAAGTDALIARADEAAYRAKHLGRNRVELSPGHESGGAALRDST
ncbi:MAG: GGDEF domain-containing protein [Candidatus Dormibacteria bacterium]